MSAVKQFKAIINNEVPAALASGLLKPSTKTGIARKPPPTPKMPVIEPITSEIKIKVGSGIFRSEFWLIGGRNIERPAAVKIIAKPERMKVSDVWQLLRHRDLLLSQWPILR